MAFYDLLEKIINKLNLAVRTDEQNLSEEQKQQVRKNIGVGAPQVQADQNQNDETAPDYIKNRLAWTENKVIFNQTITISDGKYLSEIDIELQEGTEYTVEVAGEQFRLRCQKKVLDDVTGSYEVYLIGNLSLGELGDNTGEPFLIGYVSKLRFFGITTSSFVPDGDYPVKITGTIINTIEPKYLPKDGFGYIENNYVLFDNIISFAKESGELANPSYGVIYSGIDIKDGEKYTVIIEGIEYSSAGRHFTMKDNNGEEIVYIGNGEFFGAEDTGEPFMIAKDLATHRTVMILFGLLSENKDCHVVIKNATEKIHRINPKFLPEGGFGYIDGEIEIMPEIIVPISSGGYETDSWFLPCKGGEIYTVYWNNVPYESKCSSFDIGGTEIIAIGNLRIGDSTQKDTGEPFILLSMAGASAVMTNGDDGDYTVSIRQKVIHKINSKFIPEPDMDASIGEDGYIANRQVYRDFEKVNLLANETIKGDYNSKIEEVNDNYSYGKCIVKFDNNEYIGDLLTIATIDAHIGIDNHSNFSAVDMCLFGNLSFYFGDSALNNNLPFLFVLTGTNIMVLTNDELEHTVSIDLLVPKYHFDYDKYIPNPMMLSWDLSERRVQDEEAVNELSKAYKLLKIGQKVYAKLNGEDVEVLGIKYNIFSTMQYHIKCKSINSLINYDIQYNNGISLFAITKTAEIPSIQTAEIGQTLVVKSIDENGKPTEWEATSLASVTDEQLTELATLLEGI